jgi:flavodoxin
MKAAVIYYSFEGNSAFVAEQIGAALKAVVFRLETLDQKKRRGFAKYFWGGRQVFMHRKPPLKPFSIDAASYDLLVLGAPVWAASPAPPVFTFIDQAKITGKKIALFCCHGGGKVKALEKFRAALPGNTFVGEIDFVNPAAQDRQKITEQINFWVRGLPV